MDFDSQVTAVTRRTGRRGKKRTVELEQVFFAEPPAVWDALTSPDAMSQWFDELSGNLKEGGRYRLGQSLHSGAIRTCDPLRQLDVTWEYENDVSSLHITLRAKGEETLVNLVHAVDADEHWDMYGPAATGIGWEGAFHALTLYLAGDSQSNPAEMAKQHSTPEGLQFITDLAESWREAHVAAGADPDLAKACATRTARFYRGEAPPK
ncbi:SRPBCC domain-containing protein [Flaviflexus huanghaiensis]|uniref:SRPBCC domain-containing protein n=1 Tax=Flaviflexus huanghaiensis TaxID=1111473 RepID=UPI0015F8B3C2|nr:SRPBCC domain-containing protein [Flaviflexus huanghaiensis]